MSPHRPKGNKLMQYLLRIISHFALSGTLKTLSQQGLAIRGYFFCASLSLYIKHWYHKTIQSPPIAHRLYPHSDQTGKQYA